MQRYLKATLCALVLAACGGQEMGGGVMMPNEMMMPMPKEEMKDLATGLVTVQMDPDAPLQNNYVMGAPNEKTASWRVCLEGATEEASPLQIIASLVHGGENSDMLTTGVEITNELDETIDLGAFQPTVAGKGAMNGFTHSSFNVKNVSVANDRCVRIKLRISFQTYVGLGSPSTTGQIFIPVILGSLGDEPTVIAVGVTSGKRFAVKLRTTPPPSPMAPAGSYVNRGTVFRAKLRVHMASGPLMRQCVQSADQPLHGFLVTSEKNAGKYVATIEWINPTLHSEFSTRQPRDFKMYKDAIDGSGQRVALMTIPRDTLVSRTIYFDDAGFDNIQLSSGSSKAIFPTFDDNDAPSGGRLHIRISQGGVGWSDGVTSGITDVDFDLPTSLFTCLY